MDAGVTATIRLQQQTQRTQQQYIKAVMTTLHHISAEISYENPVRKHGKSINTLDLILEP